ncbi:MAG: tRNA pseudouridine(38-40) synthase TruA [Planctomycetaceae bacterium]
MRNIALRLAYDGTRFAGWQVQNNARTVQEVVEQAILKTTGESVRLMSAGRTDAGVHALAQVANFLTSSSIPAERFRRALQTRLPEDVVVLSSCEVPAEFHSTYSATSKRYRYLMQLSEVNDPFLGRYAWRIGQSLDVAAMHDAAQSLLGTHDFRCFESHWPNRATSIRTIRDARIIPLAQWPGWEPRSLLTFPDTATAPPAHCEQTSHEPTGSRSPTPKIELSSRLLAFEVEADGFLYNMVRAITGTLYKIGIGQWPVTRMRTIIEAQNRSQAGETAPAHGLYLVQVHYPQEAGGVNQS